MRLPKNLLLVFSLLLVAACGGGESKGDGSGKKEEENPPVDPAEILEFLATPDSIEEGQPVVLSWKTKNAKRVEIKVGSKTVDLKNAPAGAGSVEVKPTVDTRYELFATGEDGKRVSTTVDVAVAPFVLPEIEFFTATPETILKGEKVTLAWKATGGESVRITAGASEIRIPDSTALEGSIQVTPTGRTTYMLKVRRGDRQAIAEAKVAYTAPEIVFAASADVVEFGEEVSFEWSVKYALSYEITDGTDEIDSGSDPGAGEMTGAFSRTPAKRTTYTIKAVGWEETVEVPVTVAVRPRLELFEVVGGDVFREEAPVTLRWKTAGADTVIISNTAGVDFVVPAGSLDEGETELPASLTGAFRLIVKTDDEVVTSDVAFDVIPVIRPGYLAITELLLDPRAGAEHQWFEIRNISRIPLRISDLEFVSGGTVVDFVPSEMLALEPGAFATFAASESVGFEPTWVYGTDLVFAPAGGELAVRSEGQVIAKVVWDASWNVPTGASLSLDGLWHKASVATGSPGDRSLWCAGTKELETRDRGSPGELGASCIIPYDVDIYSELPFLDISQTGTSFERDAQGGFMFGAAVPGGIPFDFPFYDGGTRTEAWPDMRGSVFFGHVCQDGLCFGDDSLGYVSVFQDEGPLVFQPGGDVQHEIRTIGGKKVLIVQWTNVGVERQVGNELVVQEGSVTFQAQLWAGGDVVLAYGDLSPGIGSTDEDGLAFVGLLPTIPPDWSTDAAGFLRKYVRGTYRLGNFADIPQLGGPPRGQPLVPWSSIHYRHQ